MEQFALHDLFADDFTPSHQTLTSQQVANPSIASNYMPTDNGAGHSEFNFFNGADFIQTNNAFPSVTTTSLQVPTDSVQSSQKNLFHDDHGSYSSEAVLLGNSVQDRHEHMFHGHLKSELHSNVKQETNQDFYTEHNYILEDNPPLKTEVGENKEEHIKENLKQEQAFEEDFKSELLNVVRMTTINNVVCTFNTRCHINLKRVATEGANVIFKKENNMVNMKLRKPKTTASIWSSGKITCTGCESEGQAHIAGRRIARQLQKLGFRIRFANYKVVNVLGTCFFPFAINLNSFSAENKQLASYEPELHPGVTYKMKEPRATLKIFSTGSITVTAPSEANIHAALRNIYPLVLPFQLEKEKLNPREYELTLKYLSANPEARKAGGKDRYQQFRYVKRAEEEDSYDSESSYGEDSDTD